MIIIVTKDANLFKEHFKLDCSKERYKIYSLYVNLDIILYVSSISQAEQLIKDGESILVIFDCRSKEFEYELTELRNVDKYIEVVLISDKPINEVITEDIIDKGIQRFYSYDTHSWDDIVKRVYNIILPFSENECDAIVQSLPKTFFQE